MGRITIQENPFEADNTKRITDWSGSLIEFLHQEYPAGFPGNHRLYLNGNLVAPDKYENIELSHCDDVRLYLLPGLPATAVAYIVTALITAATSIAISFVFNKLFPTKAQKLSSASSETPAAESVYALTSPSNVAALGAPIPVIYGRVLTTPKLASQPYVWYAYNEQYADILLCIGHGQFTIHEIQIAGSPIQQMPPGVVQYRVHDGNSHGQAIGNIEAQWGNHFFEDVDTSPEVSDQEVIPPDPIYGSGNIQPDGTLLLSSALDSRVGVGFTTSTLMTRLNNKTRTVTDISTDRLTITFDIPLSLGLTAILQNGVQYSYSPGEPGQDQLILSWIEPPTGNSGLNTPFGAISYEDSITLDLGGGNDAVFLSTDTTIDASSAIFIGNLTSGSLLENDLIPISQATIVFEEKSYYPYNFISADNVIGPFMTARPGSRTRAIELDFTFPNGLYTSNETTGELQYAQVDYIITLVQVDDNGNPTATPSIVLATSYGAATNTPLRYSYWADTGDGRWSAQVRRINPKSTRAIDQSDMYWTGVKAILYGSPGPIYGDVTLVSLRIKATNGIASDALNKIGIDCTRILPNGKPSENPAVIYEDIVTNTVYGAARPSSELDTPALSALQAWDTGFNGIFDFNGQVWDSIVTVLTPFQAKPVPLGSKFSAIIDRPSNAVAIFRDSNGDENGAIILDSMEFGWQYAQEGEEDGIEIEYRDPKDWIARYVRYPSDSLNPLKENLMGCTDPARALAYAKYLWNVREYRREFLTFQVELEGHLMQVGDRITVEHQMVSDSYVIGAIRALDSHRVSLETYRYDERVWS
jgi:hypothetical protein